MKLFLIKCLQGDWEKFCNFRIRICQNQKQQLIMTGN